MAYLIDSNIFLRFVSRRDPQRPEALAALRKLRARGETLYYTSQVLAEFWSVSTRPVTARGGYGLSLARAERKIKVIERYAQLLPDNQAVHQEWRRLIVAHAVAGVQVHDARLAAAMNVHRVAALLTFNKTDFKRYPQLNAIAPAEV